MMNVINDTVLVNTKEEWIIDNTTNKAHPWHIHKVQFQVVEYIGKLGFPDGVGGYVDSIGHWTWPNLPDELVGYKDVQLIRDSSIMSYEARFDSFPSPISLGDWKASKETTPSSSSLKNKGFKFEYSIPGWTSPLNSILTNFSFEEFILTFSSYESFTFLF